MLFTSKEDLHEFVFGSCLFWHVRDVDDDKLCFNASIFFVPAALLSVFPQRKLRNFTMLLEWDKEKQLKELTMIVTGIRLFNKAINKEEQEIELHEVSTVHQCTVCSVANMLL